MEGRRDLAGVTNETGGTGEGRRGPDDGVTPRPSSVMIVAMETAVEGDPQCPFNHRITGISFIRAGIDRAQGCERHRVEEVRSGGKGVDVREPELIAGFLRYLGKQKPMLVTVGDGVQEGAVLLARSFCYGLTAMPWFGDTAEGGLARLNLAESFASIGFGGDPKQSIVNARSVIGLPEASEIVSDDDSVIRERGETTAMNAYVLYLRWLLLSGASNRHAYNASMSDLAAYVVARRGERPHLGRWLDLWQGRAWPGLLLMDEVPPTLPPMAIGHAEEEDPTHGHGRAPLALDHAGWMPRMLAVADDGVPLTASRPRGFSEGARVVGAALRALRTRHAMTLQQAAKRAGISKSEIHTIEQGRRALRADHVIRLAAGYDADPLSIVPEGIPLRLAVAEAVAPLQRQPPLPPRQIETQRVQRQNRTA